MVGKPKLFLRPWFLMSGTGLAILSMASLGGTWSNKLAQQTDILPHVSVAGVNLAGLDREKANQKLSAAVEEYLTKPFAFTADQTGGTQNKTEPFEASGQDLGLIIDVDKSVQAAYEIGHQKQMLKNIMGQTLTALKGYDIPLQTNFDQSILESYFDMAFLSIEEPAHNARLKYQAGQLIAVDARTGSEIKRLPAMQSLAEMSKRLEHHEIKLGLAPTTPKINIGDLDHVREVAKNMLTSKINLYYDNYNFSPSEAEIGDWLEFHSSQIDNILGKKACACGLPETLAPAEENKGQRVPGMLVTPFEQQRQGLTKSEPYYVLLPPENFTNQNNNQTVPLVGLNRDKLNHWLLDNVSAAIDQSGQDARLSFKNGVLKVTRPSKKGVGVDLEQASRDIIFSIATPKPAVRLVLKETKPDITEDRIAELGINTLIGKGESDFTGSPQNRIHNINKGFEKYNGSVIAPGEEYSVVEHLGPVDAAAGFLPELVIVGDKIKPQYGGGLCQVSTTIFRAALDTSLPITARTNHSFSVEYYRWPYTDWGVEATIYDPAPDLKFINDTDAYILIQAYTTAAGRAIVEFYGSDPGRTTTIEGPWRISGNKVSGGSTVFKYKVRDDRTGDMLQNKEFYSYFQPLAKFKHEN